MKGTAKAFGMLSHTADRTWKEHKQAIAKPEKHKLNVCCQKRAGRRFKVKTVGVKAGVKAVPFSLRKLLCALACQVGTPVEGIGNYLKL